MRIDIPTRAPTTRIRIKRRPELNSGQDRARSQPRNAATKSRKIPPNQAHASVRIKPRSSAEPRPTIRSQRGAAVTLANSGKLLRSKAARRGFEEY